MGWMGSRKDNRSRRGLSRAGGSPGLQGHDAFRVVEVNSSSITTSPGGETRDGAHLESCWKALEQVSPGEINVKCIGRVG